MYGLHYALLAEVVRPMAIICKGADGGVQGILYSMVAWH